MVVWLPEANAAPHAAVTRRCRSPEPSCIRMRPVAASHVTRHTSHVTRHTSHVTHRASPAAASKRTSCGRACRTLHRPAAQLGWLGMLRAGVTLKGGSSKSHVTRHTSHVTRHKQHFTFNERVLPQHGLQLHTQQLDPVSEGTAKRHSFSMREEELTYIGGVATQLSSSCCCCCCCCCCSSSFAC